MLRLAARSARRWPAAVPGIELHAVDIDPAAVRCARRNLPAAHVYQGDLYQPLPAGAARPGRRAGRDRALRAHRVDPADAPGGPRPRAARPPWTAARTGSTCCAGSLAEAAPWLAPGGHLLTETGEDQVDAALAEFARHGLTARTSPPPTAAPPSSSAAAPADHARTAAARCAAPGAVRPAAPAVTDAGARLSGQAS